MTTARPPGRRRRVLVLSPYDVIPPRYGGALRTFHLCRQLSRHFEVRQFAQQVQRGQIAPSVAPRLEHVAPGYVQYSTRNPASILLFALTAVGLGSPPVWQSAMLRAQAPRWLRDELAQADLVQVEQPWQFAFVHGAVFGGTPIVVNTQNVEADVFPAHALRGPRALARRLAAAVARQEAFAVAHADRVLTATADDAAALAHRYSVPAERFAVVPNGVDCAALHPVDERAREERKAALGLAGQTVALFIGSLYRPNIEAARRITEWARTWPDREVCFVVAGAVGRAIDRRLDPRLRVTGRVDDIRPYLEAADLALNPLDSGSGSSLKLLEYMAMGLPTVTTPIGARGIPVVDGVHAFVSALDDFASRVREVAREPSRHRHVGRAARRLMEEAFDWSVIIDKALPVYEELLAPRR